MKDLKIIFEKKKPAIIGTHRINYIGRLDKKHRDRNLKTLHLILKKIVEKYPDVQFMDSGTLAEKIILRNNE